MSPGPLSWLSGEHTGTADLDVAGNRVTVDRAPLIRRRPMSIDAGPVRHQVV